MRGYKKLVDVSEHIDSLFVGRIASWVDRSCWFPRATVSTFSSISPGQVLPPRASSVARGWYRGGGLISFGSGSGVHLYTSIVVKVILQKYRLIATIHTG